MKYKRFIDAIGGWDGAAGDPRARSRRVAQTARRLDRQCRDALGARAAGRRRGHRRRPARRARASRRQSPLFAFALDAEDRRCIDAALAGPTRSRAIAATNTAGRPSSPPRAISAITWTRLPKVYQRRADAGPAGPAAHRHAAASGSRSRLQPRGPRRRSHPGQRHHRHPWRGRDRLPRRCRAARPSTSSTRSPPAFARSARGLDDVVRTRIYLRDAAQWEPVSRVHGRYLGADPPGQHAGRGPSLVGDYEVEIEAEAVAPTA